MISTKDLSGLPNAERLKNFCKGLAALDIIMVEEEWSFIRHYTWNGPSRMVRAICWNTQNESKEDFP